MKRLTALLFFTIILGGCKKPSVSTQYIQNTLHPVTIVVNSKTRESKAIRELENLSTEKNRVCLFFRHGSKFSDGTILEERGWKLYLRFGEEVEIEGFGKTISDAYEDAMKNKKALCEK